MNKLLSRLPAFTLIELLVVISIIGILAALLLANFSGIRDRADDAQLKSNLKQFQTAMRTRYNDTQTYPTAAAAAGIACGGVGSPLIALTGATPPYITMQEAALGNCRYRSPDGQTFVACATISNANDREREEQSNRCPDASEPAVANVANPRFCVCNN